MAKKKSKKVSNIEFDSYDNDVNLSELENVEIDINDIHEKQKRYVPKNGLTKIKLTEKQQKLIDAIDNNVISIIKGPAGTSKTFIDCYYAVKVLEDHKFKKIIFTKPIEESGERLGFLPGDIAEKINPYMESYKHNILKLMTKQNFDRLIKNEVIEYKPLAYMRGVTNDNCLSGDTKIQTTEGNVELKNIFEDMVTNDKVYYLQTFNIDKNQVETKELSGIQRNFTDKCVYKITFEDDSEIILTEDHVLYDKDLNYVEAQSIKVGDEIFSQ